MNPAAIIAITEIAKLGMAAYISYMQQAGLTADQIEAAFQEAKKNMLARDPANIPAS